MKRDCTICISKTKALTQISCAVTAQLICVFVFAYANSRFSHDAAHIIYLYALEPEHKTFINFSVYITLAVVNFAYIFIFLFR